MAEQFANNASTTLNGGINNSTTSVVVTDGSVFPASGNYRVICGSEIMLVTSRSTNTLTVTRGAEATTAASHSSGDSISHVFTKDSLEQFISDFEQSGGYSSRSASPRKGTVYTATDLQARWVYDGTNWDLIYPVYVSNARKWSTSGWTAQNQSTATFTDKNGILEITTVPPNNNAIRGYSKTMPSTPYKATWIVGTNPQAPGSFSFYVGHRENSSGKVKVMFKAGNLGGIVGVEQWLTFNSFNATLFSQRLSYSGRTSWQRVENDGTNFKYYTSHDGKNFTQIYSELITGFWTTAADQIFFGAFAGTQYATNETGAFNLLGYWEE